MKRIVFIIPYFGPWPEWMPLFLVSCRFNPSINWVLISDSDLPVEKPDNVRHVRMDWADYVKLVSERLGIDFRPASPYKLCDIKPALAEIHPEFVEGFDYWAFGDIDVIYGNIRKFYTDEFLKYGLISTHPNGISGHFCLLRNDPKTNAAFRKVRKWDELLCDPKHRKFDEGPFRRIFLKDRSAFEWLRQLKTRLDSYCRDAFFFEAHSTPWGYLIDSDVERPPERWIWQEGRLVDALDLQRELMYLHFMNWKSNRYLWINGYHGVAAWTGIEKLVNVSEKNIHKRWVVGHEGFVDFEE